MAGTGKGSVVLGVDGGHLVDEQSAALVHQLAVRRAGNVVLTLRTGETAPDAVTALWKDGHLTRLELQPLSDDETTSLIEAALGRPVDSVAARRLWSITRGNALYLRQLVDGELESTRLRQIAGVWRWAGQPEVSPGLAELLSGRGGRLTPGRRGVPGGRALGEPVGGPPLVLVTHAGGGG